MTPCALAHGCPSGLVSYTLHLPPDLPTLASLSLVQHVKAHTISGLYTLLCPLCLLCSLSRFWHSWFPNIFKILAFMSPMYDPLTMLLPQPLTSFSCFIFLHRTFHRLQFLFICILLICLSVLGSLNDPCLLVYALMQIPTILTFSWSWT